MISYFYSLLTTPAYIHLRLWPSTAPMWTLYSLENQTVKCRHIILSEIFKYETKGSRWFKDNKACSKQRGIGWSSRNSIKHKEYKCIWVCLKERSQSSSIGLQPHHARIWTGDHEGNIAHNPQQKKTWKGIDQN